MAATASVTYMHHSGFLVAQEDTLLIFDYWRGENGEINSENALDEAELNKYKTVIFFVSHEHPDHYDRVIYDFKNLIQVHYVVSFDMPSSAEGFRMAAGDQTIIGPAYITAYSSTDLGVSYYVVMNGLHIFHAGDLNLWHWRDESTLRQITQAENLFYDTVRPLNGLPMDICMFPVDPRLGGMFEAGANHFIMTCKPRVFIPMHWQGRSTIATDYAHNCRTKYTEGLALTKPRERADLTFNGKSIDIRVFKKADQEDLMKRRHHSEDASNSSAAAAASLEKNDPFSGSDLPVDQILKS